MKATMGGAWVQAEVMHARRVRVHRLRSRGVLFLTGWVVQIGLAIVTWMLATASIEAARASGDGDLTRRLSLLIAGTLFGVIVLTAFSMIDIAISREQIGLFLPIALAPETRWRMLLVKGVLASASPFAVVALTIALLQVGWLWAIVFLLWIPVALGLGVLLILAIAWIFGGSEIRYRLLAVSSCAVLGITFLAESAFLRYGDSQTTWTPLMLIPDALLFTGVIWGPGARSIGNWYVRVAQQMYDAPSRSFRLFGPITKRLCLRLDHWRTPVAAVIAKEMRTQTRDPFLLMRIALVVGALPCYMVLRLQVLNWFADADEVRAVAAFAILLALYCMIETTPSPFGGEGNRLMHALLAPVSSRMLLLGKSIAVLCPVLLQAWITFLGIAFWCGVSFSSTMVGFGMTTITVSGLALTLTCGSTLDIDLRRKVEDRSQAILAEHVPAGSRRLALLSMCMGIALLSILIMRGLPAFTSVGLLLLLHGSTVLVCLRFALRHLDRARF